MSFFITTDFSATVEIFLVVCTDFVLGHGGLSAIGTTLPGTLEHAVKLVLASIAGIAGYQRFVAFFIYSIEEQQIK